MTLDEYDDVQRSKVCVYGPPFSGKTALVGQLAEWFTLHFFDCDQGIKTLRNPKFLDPKFRKNILLYNVPDHRSYPIAIDVLRRIFKGGDYRFCYAHCVHACAICSKIPSAKWSETINLSKFTDKDILVIDSWTQVVNSAANKVTLKAWQKDDEYKMDFDDWRMQGMYLDEVLSKIKTANIHTCVISHEIDVEKDEKKEKIVPIGGTRNFSKTMGKYFDEVVHLQMLNARHSAHSASTWNNTTLTGSRSGIRMEDSTPEKPIGLKEIFLAGSAKVVAITETPGVK